VVKLPMNLKENSKLEYTLSSVHIFLFYLLSEKEYSQMGKVWMSKGKENGWIDG
jgi:hypothetical protein